MGIKKIKAVIIILITMIITFCLVGCQNDIEEKADLIIEGEDEVVLGYEGLIFVESSVNNDIISFASSNEEILIIDQLGNYKALDFGTVIVSISSKTGTVVEHEITVNGRPPLAEIKFSVNHEGIFYTDQKYKISCEYSPIYSELDLKFVYPKNQIIFDEETWEIIFLDSGNFTLIGFSKEKIIVRGSIEFNVEYPEDTTVYSLLFLGNSFTKCVYYDIPNIIKQIIEIDGDKARVFVDAPGGSYIDQHKQVLNNYLETEKFTHVFLQEQSRGPIDYYTRFEKAVMDFADIINNSGAQTILYQTWCYNLNHFSGNSTLQENMKLGLEQAYDKAATKADLYVSRAGTAFYNCIANYPNINLYVDNNGHASTYGAYLSACVHYCTITGKSPINNGYDIAGIDDSIKLILQTIAYQTYLDSLN